jgi:hypothetical protein
VVVGCEDGLLGCIMGSGVPLPHADAATSHDSAGGRDGTEGARTDVAAASDATAAAAAAVESIVRAATGGAAEIEAEQAAEVAAAAAAAAAAAIAAAEAQDAGVFRAIRVHDAAVLCVGVMTYTSHSLVFMSGGADGRLVMCRY